MQRIIWFLAMGLALIIAASATGCGLISSTNNSEAANNSITVTDSLGRSVTVSLPIERVVILDRGSAEILTGLGVSDKLVGIHQSLVDDPTYPHLQNLPVVATWSEINFEAIALANPDLVISSDEGGHGTVSENEHLDEFGITDLKMNLRDPNQMSQDIQVLGEIFQVQGKAADLTSFYEKYQRIIDTALEQIPTADRRKVFLEYHAGPYRTGGPDSAWYSQVIRAGGVNLASGLSGTVEVSPEWLAEGNPDVIIREGSGLGLAASEDAITEAKELRHEILTRPGIHNVSAIANEEVYVIPNDIISRPGYIVGVAAIAKILYPDQLTGVNINKIHREYFKLFHPEVEFGGSWIYPELQE